MSEQDYNSKSYDEIFICDSSEIDSLKQHKKKNSDTLVNTKLSNKNIYNLQLPNQEMGAYVLEENKNDPSGLLGSWIPAFDRLIAFDTLSIASN